MEFKSTKGKPLKRLSRRVHSVIESKIEQHSKKKPDIVKNKIIELFARKQTEGWDVFNNEVESSITINVK